jgi:hypothetical protein
MEERERVVMEERERINGYDKVVRMKSPKLCAV